MALMVVVLMGICHPFDSIEEKALARTLLICMSAAIVEWGRWFFWRFFSPLYTTMMMLVAMDGGLLM